MEYCKLCDFIHWPYEVVVKWQTYHADWREKRTKTLSQGQTLRRQAVIDNHRANARLYDREYNPVSPNGQGGLT